MKKILVLCILECDFSEDDPMCTFNKKLDVFYEAVPPSQNYGLKIYKATKEDLHKFAESDVSQFADYAIEES